MSVPPIRIVQRNERPVSPDGEFVLYWMIAARRPHSNFALDHALALGREIGRPVLVLEALRSDYPHASDRLHRFVIEGMADNQAAFEASGVGYHPYVEPTTGAGKGLLQALSERAAAVVTDEYPCFFLPRMVAAAARQVPVQLETVDGCGLLPLRAIPERDGAPRWFSRAYDLRRHLQKTLPQHLDAAPARAPLDDVAPAERPSVPPSVAARWPAADLGALLAPGGLDALPIDHTVPPVADRRGGARAGSERLETFVAERLGDYLDERNHPDADATSGLSPYLHFGHVSPHDVLATIADEEDWTTERLGSPANGKREGWWAMSPAAEAYLDQVVTWRELGFHTCHVRPGEYDRFTCLPDWARRTLDEHAADPRDPAYDESTLERAATHDEVWNAAQRQLLREGRIHNYLRMLWGKNVLAWSESPEAAHRILVRLNDRYALDGRDPNSYSGIRWVLGGHDRPWGPTRPVFGSVRYMTSASARRKLRLKETLLRFASTPTLF